MTSEYPSKHFHRSCATSQSSGPSSLGQRDARLQQREHLCEPGVDMTFAHDPVGCPCCASVFAETLTGAEVNLAKALVSGPALTQVNAAPVWVSNANIYTMDAKQPVADTLIVEDGRIVWVGLAQDLPSAVVDDLTEDTLRIDAKGKTLLPGFVEPHMHLVPVAMLHAFENVGPFRFERIADAIDHLAAFAKANPELPWIVGRQFDPSLQEGPDALTADLLDKVSLDRPVFVYNASLHLGYCNSAALALAGLTAQTEDPAGAALGRDIHGNPNGVLKGGPAMGMVARHNPLIKSQSLGDACLDVLKSANAVGFTTICDQGTGLFQGAKELALYDHVRQSGRMTARFRYSLAHAAAKHWDATDIAWGDGDVWMRAAGWKIVADGSNQGRTGLQRESFLGTDSLGIPYIEVDELNAAVSARLDQGWALAVHANGDAAIDRVLDAFELAQQQGLDPSAMRCRIEHCSILHDEHIERIKALGLSPSFLIGHVHYWGKTFVDDIFGLEKAEKLDRTGTCEAAGIRWTLHSDDPVSEMNPLRCVENAVTRNMWRSEDLLSPNERVDVAVALRAMTIDAAWQCHSDHELGSLEVGKLADFVLLEQDPHEVQTQDIGKIEVAQTWVNGVQVYAG